MSKREIYKIKGESPMAADDTVKRTLQIATVGEDSDTVLVGVRNYPLHKLAMIAHKRDEEIAEQTRKDIQRALNVPVDIYTVENRILEGALETIVDIMERDGENFDDVIVNVAGGEKLLTCATLSAAFINGLKAFHVMGSEPVPLPVLKLSYNEVVSSPKLNILTALGNNGGEARDLKELSELSGYGKPLLSYHINGTDESKGLLDLGLVTVTRGKRSRTNVHLTTLGKLLLLSSKEDEEE